MTVSGVETSGFAGPTSRWCRLFLGLLLAVGSLAAMGQDRVVRSIAEIARLTPEQAMSKRRVDVEGLVISRARFKNLLFLQGHGVGLVVYAAGTNSMVETGTKVAVRGFTIFQEGTQVFAEEIETLGFVDLPAAEKVKLSAMNERAGAVRWVELDGTIKSARLGPGGSRMVGVLRQNGQLLDLRIRPPYRLPVGQFRFSSVKLTGVLMDKKVMGISQPGKVLWVAGQTNVLVKKVYYPNPFNRIPTKIGELTKNVRPNALWDYRPRVSGRVTAINHEAREFTVSDGTGEIVVQPMTRRSWLTNDLVDVVGYTEWGSNGLYLGTAEVGVRAMPKGVPGITPDGPKPVRTTLASVKALKTDELLERLVVRVEGQITYNDPSAGLCYVQHGGVGVRLMPMPALADLPIGTVLQINGHAEPGDFTPRIRASEIRVTDTNSLPQGGPAYLSIMRTGQTDGNLITGEGIVRSAEKIGDDMQLGWNQYGATYAVFIKGAGDFSPDRYVGARVTVTGVAQAIVNRLGFVVDSKILIGSADMVKINQPAVENPFETLPLQTVKEVFAYGSTILSGRRSRIEGVVTLSWPGKLYVQDETGSIEVRTGKSYNLRMGDKVTVIGFVVLGSARPVMEDASVLRTGAGDVPAAEKNHALRVINQQLDGRRAVFDGKLMSKTLGVREYVLMLLDGDVTVPMVLRRRIGPLDLERFELGSKLRATGICELSTRPGRASSDMRLLVDSAQEIKVIERPPFFTPKRTLGAVGGLVLIVAGSLGWVAFLSKRVAQTQSRFATAFRASPVPVAIMTRGSRKILDVNDSFVEKFEISRRQAVAKRFDDLRICLESGFFDRLEKQIASQQSVRAVDCEMRSVNGKARYILLSVELIDIDDEECLLFIFQDVTERLALMDQLRESQKMEAVGQLAAGVAHDFNNLLTIIRGNTDILADIGKTDEELLEISGELSDATSRASDLTRQLLAFSRKQVMQPRIVDLNTVISGGLKMVKRLVGEGIVVESELVHHELPVFADAGMLDQILVNFVVNARDAMDGHGKVKISTSIEEIDEGDVKQHPEGRAGSYVVFKIADTGSGMDAETRKRIFEPFFTTKEVGKGTGLGLATVYGIAKQHRGWIAVESEPGEGTVFGVYLPMAESEEQEDTVVVVNDRNLRGNESILVAEDENAVRRMICRTLERAGYTIWEADNAHSARELWEEHKSEVDMLLTDLMMPGGSTGFELAAELTADRPELPVIYVSGYSAEMLEKGHELDVGINFLSKPFTNKSLLEAVRSRLEGVRKSAEQA